MKKFQRNSTTDSAKEKKESMNCKILNLKLSSQKSKKKNKRNEESMWNLQDIMMKNNKHTMGITKGAEKEKESIFKD